MITVKNIEDRLRTIDYTKPAPDRAMLEALVSDGRSRILKSASIAGLCPDSDRYFEFCLSQVGSFCSASYNAVEIALACGLQPIYVAAAINVHGSDWGHKLLGLKRFATMDRGNYTVWRSGEFWYALGESQRRVEKIVNGLSQQQNELRKAINRADMEYVLRITESYPHRIMSLMDTRTELMYTDPRIERSKKQREKAKQEAAAAGKRLVDPGAYNDMSNTFNRSITPRDPNRPSPADGYITVSGRKYHP